MGKRGIRTVRLFLGFEGVRIGCVFGQAAAFFALQCPNEACIRIGSPWFRLESVRIRAYSTRAPLWLQLRVTLGVWKMKWYVWEVSGL